MSKTLADLRDSLAQALGYEYADLGPLEQADVDTIINAAYLDCFAAKDGRRPKWLTQYWSDIVKAPASASLGLTHGSKTVTGFAFEAKYVGSFVKIGDAFYRLASVEGAGPFTYKLVQPWAGETGSYSATVYYNAVALPGTVTKVREVPSLLGIGPLTPMPFPESETEIRSTPSFDFESRSGRVPFAYARPRFDPSLITDVGDPRYYHVDSAATGETFATSSRLHLYPLPGSAFTVELRADIVPSALSAADDQPKLPHDDIDVVGAIMMPLMFERLLKHPLGRRYAGDNVPAIFQGGVDARALLNTFRSVQLDGPKFARVSRNW
jgi:hypothetical protein